MREADDLEHALRFAELLDAAEARQARPRVRPSQAPYLPHDLGVDVELVGRLRSVTPSTRELATARAHVAQQLAEAMRMELDDTAPMPVALRSSLRLVSPTGDDAATERRATRQPRSGSIWVGMRRIGLVAAVLFILCAGLFSGLSAAAASALPESSLYGVKRADEATLLAVAWNDSLRGQALATIAGHRLNEAAAEADAGRMIPARTLLGQFDSAVSQMVTLTASVQSRHQDASALVTSLRQTLQAEQAADHHARSKGQASFDAALQASVSVLTVELRQHSVNLTNAPNGAPNGASGASSGKGRKGGTGPGSNGGSHGNPNGSPNGSANGGSSQGGGHVTQTPTAGAASTPGGTPTTPTKNCGTTNGNGNGNSCGAAAGGS